MSCAAMLGLSKYFLFSKLVSVEDFGLYSLVMSLYIFLVFIGGMGLQEGLLKKGSEKYAVDDLDSIKQYFTVAVVYATFSMMVIGIVSFLFGMLWFENQTILNLVIVGILLSLSAVYFNVLDAFLRSKQKFTLYSSLLFAKGVLVLLAGFFLADGYGAIGLVSAEFTSLMVVFLITILVQFKPRELITSVDHEVAKVLISNGSKMMFSIVIRNLSLMMDKWFVALSVGVLALGYYSFAMILLSVAMISLGFVVTLKGPVWISMYQNIKLPVRLFEEITKVVKLLVMIMILFFPLVYFALPGLLEFAYPKYANNDVFWLFVIVYVSIIFIIPIYLYDWLFIATSNEKSLVFANIASLAFSGTVLSICWLLNLSVVHFALAFLSSRAFLLASYIFHMNKQRLFHAV